MAQYLFNFSDGDATEAAGLLRLGMWGVDADEPHRNALGPGDVVLVYVAAPVREFIGRAELASAVHDWTPPESRVYPGDSQSGVLLAQVEEWEPPLAISAVLAQIGPSEKAKADFEVGVVRITAHEYEAALAFAAESASSSA
jgi:hypothetical protein